MTESLLLTFFKNVYSKNLNYCVVCLRTSDERRLAKPYYVKKFSMSINQPFMLNDPNQMACYLCERQAAAALRFRKASSLATFAISIVATMRKNHKKYEMIRTSSADEKNQVWLTSVLHCESEMMQQRARSQLLLTEVLVISSPTTTEPESSNLVILSEATPMVSIMLQEQTHISTLGESRDLYVVPDEAPRERVCESWELTQKPEEGMSSIIIYDEEDDPININPEILPTNDLLVITDPIAQQKDPLNTTKDAPNKLVPILKLLENPRVGEMSLLDTNNVIETAPTELILHPIIFNSGMMTVPTLSANIVDGKLVTNNSNSSNLLGTPKLALRVGENLDFISDPNKVTNVLRVLSHQDAAKVHIFIGDLPNTSQSSTTVQKIAQQSSLNVNKVVGISKMNFTSSPVIEVGNTYDPLVSKNPAPNKNSSPPNKIPTALKYSSTGKKPSVRQQGGPAILRTDRIDWEDKIPMDVISFVDDNDTITKRPRYSDNQTPLGITDVVSLNNEEVIIDLC